MKNRRIVTTLVFGEFEPVLHCARLTSGNYVIESATCKYVDNLLTSTTTDCNSTIPENSQKNQSIGGKTMKTQCIKKATMQFLIFSLILTLGMATVEAQQKYQIAEKQTLAFTKQERSMVGDIESHMLSSVNQKKLT